MDVDAYSARLQRELGTVAAAGGDDTLAVAERLAAAMESSVRLALIEALVEAAGEITDALAPGSVEVRLLGRDVQFAVTAQVPPAPPAAAPVAAFPQADEGDDDGGTARLSLRLPERLKPKVEQAAAAAGLSVNAWLVRSIGALVEVPAPPTAPTPAQTTTGRRISGWAR